MRFDDTRTEWRVSDVERKVNECSNRLHEINSLRRDVDSLERANREISTENDGLRFRLEEAEENIKIIIEQLKEVIK